MMEHGLSDSAAKHMSDVERLLKENERLRGLLGTWFDGAYREQHKPTCLCELCRDTRAALGRKGE